jgi:phage tail sheath protein FI
MLFEFNDNFTRARFSSIVNKFLSTVEAQRGLYDFKVVCDTTNNTPTIIDNNQFVANIMLKPEKAAEFITLYFTAVSTGVSFTEVTNS